MSSRRETSPSLPLPLDQDSSGTPMGGPNESAASLIQSMQRTAFLQNRIEDDRWIAQFASTCFTDLALVWYLGLEKDIQSSWDKLRLALIQQYPVRPPRSTVPAAVPVQPTSPITNVGRIEVVRAEFGDVLGYLSEDGRDSFAVDSDPENALTLQAVLHTDSQQQSQKIYSLKMINASDPKFPFLGLRLVKSWNEDPNVVPPTESKDVTWSAVQSVPSCCKPSEQGLSNVTRASRWDGQKATEYATWQFIQTTESRRGPYYARKAEPSRRHQNARVVSAVWTILNSLPDATELGLTWPGENGRRGSVTSEIALDPVILKGEMDLHAHAYDFPKKAEFYLDERLVVFLFKPIPSSSDVA
ncbi:hypothetical protein FRC00_002960 [Tulasnella sp. 408]|nr:hypothetical protein FRC00_002960 [Tulasnella sp. 408]